MELPIFPLPELVLFPDVVIPLHIFEPRYKQLMKDLLKKPEDERIFVLATYVGTKSSETFDDAPFYPLATVCKLIEYTELEDGRSNILVHGVSIVSVKEVEFLNTTTPYRIASITPKDPDWEVTDESKYRKQTLNSLNQYATKRNLDLSDVKKLNLREMANLLSYALPFTMEEKFSLLAKDTLESRINLLIELMSKTYKLIEFSENFDDEMKRVN
jgi:Lon protease-like protein